MFSLIMVDVDHFKTINDTFGHPAGDLVLKELVKRLNGAIRRPDVLGRYGGEEFLIIVDASTAGHLLTAMERLRTVICAEAFNVGSQQCLVTASFGGIVAPPGTAPADLIRKADKALYQAKAGGRNRCVIGDSVAAPVSH